MKKTQRSFNSTIRKSGAPKKTNPARRKREWIRAYGSKEYVAWLHRQPCVGCGYTPSQCHHIQTGGMGRKDDRTRTIPLCNDDDGTIGFGCHGRLHTMGRESFEKRRGINLETEAARIQELWRASLGSSPGGET